MPNVKYAGYFNAFTGMGNACRNYIHALDQAGVSITTQLIKNSDTTAYLGEAHKTARINHGRDLDYKIKIIHITPDGVTPHLEPMKYHIFHFFWETDKLPDWFVWGLNLVDEVWTGSEWSKEVFIKSGVKSPIYVFPQPIDSPPDVPVYQFRGQPDYIFYSMFEWHERKNPKALLNAYWEEFRGKESVGLLIKTYKQGNFSDQSTAEILRQIKAWKIEIGGKNLPPVFIYAEEEDRTGIWRFHKTGSCFVLPHRGEGWGIPIAEAAALGKPIIATKLGGITEHIPENLWHPLKDIKMTNLFNMKWCPWYNEEQKWAMINKDELRRKMRNCYEKYELEKPGLKEYIKDNFSYANVGHQLKKRLIEIEKGLIK